MEDLEKPGFSHLPLDILEAETLDYDNIATYHFPRLERQLYEKQRRSESIVIRNFLAFVAIRLGWSREALHYFEQVLDKDPDNLNALTNLKMFYEKQSNYARINDVSTRLSELEPMLSNDSDERSRVIRARCLAEKAFAICRGSYYENESILLDAMDMYEKALEIAGDLVTTEERTDWYLGKVRAGKDWYQKRSNWRRPQPEVEFEGRFIADVLNVLEDGDDLMKAEAWVKLASFFNSFFKTYRNNNSPSLPRIPNHELLTCYRSACPQLACYKKALELKPNDPYTLSLLVGCLRRNHYHTVEDFQSDHKGVFRLLNASLKQDGSIFNRCSFSTKAEALMDFYRAYRKEKRHEQEDYNMLLKLKEAKATYEMSIRMHTEPADCRQMGEIWFYLAEDYSDESLRQVVGKTKAKCMEKALEYYTIATEIHPSGSQNPHTHWKRGECLFKMNRFAEAVESYKQGINCYYYPSDFKLKTFSKLFSAQIAMLERTGSSDEHKNIRLAKDAAQWLEKALREFSPEDRISKCFQYHCRSSYRDDFVKRCHLFIDLCNQIGYGRLERFIQDYITLQRQVAA